MKRSSDRSMTSVRGSLATSASSSSRSAPLLVTSASPASATRVYGSPSDSPVATDVVSRSTPVFYHMKATVRVTRPHDSAQPPAVGS